MSIIRILGIGLPLLTLLGCFQNCGRVNDFSVSESLALNSTSANPTTNDNTCGPTLAVGASCTIAIQFAPTDRGTRTGSVKIFSNASATPEEISLSGSGN